MHIRVLAGSSFAAFVAAGVSLIRGADTTYPEMGDPIPPEKGAEKRLDAWGDCAIDGLPEPWNRKLERRRHGHTVDQGAPGITPHATPEQLENCQLSMAIDLERFCMRTDVINSNDDLFNHPNDGDDSVAGENGNEPCPQDETHKADKDTRALIDAFDDLRSKLTEAEATLAGEVKLGRNPPKEIGDWWLKPEKKKEGPDCPPRLCRDKWDECKMKVFDMAAAGKMKAGDAYRKHRNLAKKLCDAKERMCKDIEAMKMAIAKAKMKYCA